MFNFRCYSQPQIIFNSENFPIYGRHIRRLSALSPCKITQLVFLLFHTSIHLILNHYLLVLSLAIFINKSNQDFFLSVNKFSLTSLPNITKYIPRILEIEAASLKRRLAVEDAPASSVALVLNAWLEGKGAPSSWRRLIWALDMVKNNISYEGPQSVADNIRKFAEPPQGMIIMHDCIVS